MRVDANQMNYEFKNTKTLQVRSPFRYICSNENTNCNHKNIQSTIHMAYGLKIIIPHFFSDTTTLNFPNNTIEKMDQLDRDTNLSERFVSSKILYMMPQEYNPHTRFRVELRVEMNVKREQLYRFKTHRQGHFSPEKEQKTSFQLAASKAPT